MVNAVIAMCFFIFVLIIEINFFSKKGVITLENKIYGILLVANIVGLILQVSSYYVPFWFNLDINSLEYHIIVKANFLYYLFWVSFLVIYVRTICIESNSYVGLWSRFNKIIMLLFVLSIVVVGVLPLTILTSGNEFYPSGISVVFVFLLIGIYSIFLVVILIKNYNERIKNKLLPLVSFLFLGSIGILIQSMYPVLILNTPIESLVLILMFFTIENPDLDIVVTYEKMASSNLKIIKDKEMYIHNLRSDILLPLVEIERVSIDLINDNNSNKDELYKINDLTKKIELRVKGLSDSYSDVKVINSKYKREIIFSYMNNLKKDSVDIRVNIDESIPEYLYGDGYKIKETMMNLFTQILNKIDHGYLDISLDCLIRNNLVRLIWDIKMNGVIDLDSSMVDKIGTYINLNNEKMVIIDQQISQLHALHKIDQLVGEKVLILEKDKKLIKKWVRYLNAYNFTIETSDLGVYALNKVRENNDYKFILISDNIEPLSGLETYYRLKRIGGFDIPVVLISDNMNFKEKDYYLKAGLSNIITSKIDKETFEQVIIDL